MDSPDSGKQRLSPLRIPESGQSTPKLAPSPLGRPAEDDGRGVARISTDMSALDVKGLSSRFNSSMTPPSTPPTRSSKDSFSQPQSGLRTDSEHLTLDTQEAELLGSGLWSKVYKVEVALPEKARAAEMAVDLPTPPSTPQRARGSAPRVYAVKVASRPDAKDVFEEEARIFTHLGHDSRASTFIIPFYGLFNSSTTLVLHCANTDLASYSTRFSSPDSLTALLDFFTPVSSQLIAGLAYMHARHVIHADIKPANILIDLTASGPIARYADFSASSISPIGPAEQSPLSALPPSRPGSFASPVGGGTWTFMAPEQLSSNPATNAPSFAADVYALGITLLTVLLGGATPFRDVAHNVFLLREAVKTGAPVGFARGDPAMGKRRRALEGEGEERGRTALQAVALAVKKKPSERVRADEWCKSA